MIQPGHACAALSEYHDSLIRQLPVRPRYRPNPPALHFANTSALELGPNVKDEPRPQRARLVLQNGSRFNASF